MRSRLYVVATGQFLGNSNENQGHLHHHLTHRSFAHKTFVVMIGKMKVENESFVLVILLQSVKFNMVVLRGK